MTSIRGPALPEELARLAEGEVLERTCGVLLTDVVDSPTLAASIGDAQSARLWADHDRAANRPADYASISYVRVSNAEWVICRGKQQVSF